MTVTEKLLRLKAINIRELFDDVLRENEETICNMNRSQMYDEGVMDVNNPSSKEHYSPVTKEQKKKAPFNKTEFITLKWMGTFHKSLKLIIFKDIFLISSDNLIWANYLETQSRFGKALGMTKSSKNELRDIARDSLIRKIRNVA